MVDARTPLDPWRAPPLRLVDDAAPVEAAIAVVLACSSADAPSLTAAAELLGLGDVRVLPGMDVRTDHLRSAVVRASLPTLFVVCRSASLDGEQARLAAGTFGSRRSAHHRLLVAQYDSSRPGPFMTAIRRAWSSMQAAFEVSSGPVAGMVGSGLGNAVGGETHIRAAEVDRIARPGPPVRVAAVEVSRRAENASASPPTWRDAVGTIPAHVRAPGRSKHALTVLDLQDTARTPVAAESADARDTEDDGPAAVSDAVLVRPTDRGTSPAASIIAEPTPSRATRIGASALVGLVVVAFAAVPTLGDRDAVAVGSSIGAASALDDASPGATESSASVVTREAAPEVARGASPEPAATPDATREAPSPATAVVVEARAPTMATAASVPPTASDEASPAEARMAGLYVVDGPEVPLDWYRAANTCRARKVDGQRGFRLPTIDELRWLRRGGRVAAGRAMWTGTRVRGSAGENWIVDAKGTMRRLAKTEDVAYAVCVRMP